MGHYEETLGSPLLRVTHTGLPNRARVDLA